MVGHTGSLPAAIKAVETVDTGLGRIAEAVRKAGGALLVTADHGNCEMMRDPDTGEKATARRHRDHSRPHRGEPRWLLRQRADHLNMPELRASLRAGDGHRI